MEGNTARSHFQKVMSPRLGAASGMLNGANTRMENPLPSQTGELAGDGLQQAKVMTAGPSTSTAVQVPSPLLPRDDRTGGYGASGQVGSLGATGVMYGSVSTAGIADASGHDPPAANPEGSTGSVKFQTPRSCLQGASAVIGAQTQAFATQTFSGLMGRVQSLCPANVQAIPPTWMPSPLRQSPATSTPKPVPPGREGRHV